MTTDSEGIDLVITDMIRLVWLIGHHEVIEGRTRLQKLVYILKMQHEINFSFDYHSYFYGPYSQELTDYVQAMIACGVIREDRRPHGWYDIYNISLDKKGLELFATLKREVASRTVQELTTIKTLIESLKNVSTSSLGTTAKKIMFTLVFK